MKLIPLSEYVELQLITKQSTSEFKEAIKNYAIFLMQPLTLGMFVPVDDEDEVLKDISDDEDDDFGLCSVIRRQKIAIAKNNVLFEGFSQTSEQIEFAKYICNVSSQSTVEDLINYGFTLTPSALKLIGEKE